MSGVILAVVQHPDAARAILLAADQAARLMRAARVNVLAIRTPAIAMVPVSEGMLSFAEEDPTCALEATRLATLQRGFTAWAAARPVGAPAAEWVELDGWAEQLVDEWGERADLIVIGRPAATPSEPERRALHAALFDTNRPVLVVPPGHAAGFGARVAIAWRDDARTTQAVLAALRWLGGAEIHVLTGARAWSAPPALPPIFAEHGITAQLHVLPVASGRGFGEALLARAHEIGADAVVLGAFAHPMLRGLILGGVTKYMLSQADLPVLMRH